MPEPWEVLESETILDSSWLRVRRQRVRAANGHELPEYYVLDTADIVVLLALTSDGQAILVRQYRHGIRQGLLELPAGLIENTDRTPAAAAERELLEETGFKPDRLILLGRLFPSPARQSNVVHCFLALDCDRVADPGGDPAEVITLSCLSLPDLRAAALRGDLASVISTSCLFLGLERLAAMGLE